MILKCNPHHPNKKYNFMGHVVTVEGIELELSQQQKELLESKEFKKWIIAIEKKKEKKPRKGKKE